ncbi:MAG: cytochrome P450 [Rhizomicrobium sp.]
MSNYDEIDVFTDAELSQAPHGYFEHLRAKGPAARLPRHGVVAVTSYDAGLAIFRDDERFSAINTATGPFLPLPFTPEGDDITVQLEQCRSELPYAGQIVALDPPAHTKQKSLLMGMITPKRLKENETFMAKLSDRIIGEFIERGSVEVISEYAQPFATLVIADLLGVPEEDHQGFRKLIGALPGQIGVEMNMANNPLVQIGMNFYGYIEDRRREPRQDVLTELAQQRYADGSLPELLDVVSVATFLFGAGQDTTVRLFAAMLRFLAEEPELQRKLRSERHLIPEFVEEVLRLEGTVKSTFRMAKVPVKVGDIEVSPGTCVMLLISAMNRDPMRFENPAELRLDRKNVREHLAFGRGIHSCAGAPLARAEAKVTLERLFDRTSDIRIDETEHGPAGVRRFEYEPNYLIRAMKALHLEFDKA